MSINIEHTELVRPAKRIGTTDDGEDVYEAVLKGGLVVIEAVKKDKSRRLGAGPHRGLARYIARKREGDRLQLTELSKSEALGPEYWIHLVPEYEAVTDRLNGK